MPCALEVLELAQDVRELERAGELGLEQRLGVGVHCDVLGFGGVRVEDRCGGADEFDFETADVGAEDEGGTP